MGDDVTVMPQLIAALDDERQGVVVVGGQLVTVQDQHLSAGHLLLGTTRLVCKGLNIKANTLSSSRWQ